jgi:dethiobiotin synthetase
MKSEIEIKNLLINEHLNQKKINCLGCIFNSLSQIRHDVCLYNYNSEYYFEQAVEIVKNSLNCEEKQILKKILQELSDE